MVTRSVPALVVVPLVAAALLAGCGGSDTPPSSTSSTSTTSSPSPASASSTPSASTAKPTAAPTTATPTARIPTAAKAHSKAGAEAFVRAYFAEVNRAWTMPSATTLAPYAQPSCKSCAASLATATELVAKRHRYDGPPATIKSAVAILDGPNDIYRVTVGAVQERRHIVDSAGKVISTDPRQPSTLEVALVWSAGRWKIATVKRVA